MQAPALQPPPTGSSGGEGSSKKRKASLSDEGDEEHSQRPKLQDTDTLATGEEDGIHGKAESFAESAVTANEGSGSKSMTVEGFQDVLAAVKAEKVMGFLVKAPVFVASSARL